MNISHLEVKNSLITLNASPSAVNVIRLMESYTIPIVKDLNKI